MFYDLFIIWRKIELKLISHRNLFYSRKNIQRIFFVFANKYNRTENWFTFDLLKIWVKSLNALNIQCKHYYLEIKQRSLKDVQNHVSKGNLKIYFVGNLKDASVLHYSHLCVCV